MREILLTSSVLIAALLVLRKVFQKTISRRTQYALWGLVVLRLLVPVNLPALHYNVLTAAEPVQTQVAARLERQTVALPVERAPWTSTRRPGTPCPKPRQIPCSSLPDPRYLRPLTAGWPPRIPPPSATTG